MVLGLRQLFRGKSKEEPEGVLRKEENKKSSAAGSFGVAQSPKSSYGGTLVMVTSSQAVARGISKKVKKFSLFFFLVKMTEERDDRFDEWSIK